GRSLVHHTGFRYQQRVQRAAKGQYAVQSSSFLPFGEEGCAKSQKSRRIYRDQLQAERLQGLGLIFEGYALSVGERNEQSRSGVQYARRLHPFQVPVERSPQP